MLAERPDNESSDDKPASPQFVSEAWELGTKFYMMTFCNEVDKMGMLQARGALKALMKHHLDLKCALRGDMGKFTGLDLPEGFK